MYWLQPICLASTLSLANICLAANTTSTSGNFSVSTYVDPNVPTEVPIVGDYGGRYRPQIHYSPPKHFMNDPNGMFRDDEGVWHLYYQYNPTGIVAGNQHWGHATSDDLYHWVNQPIALFPPRKTQYIFSGSAVTDPNNTSGFFPSQKNGVVAIYTLAEYGEDGSPGPQTQAIAYSHDGGYTFTPYQGNPVISSNSSQFRDPKVIWYKDHWVLVIAYAQEYEIGIFTSPDLKEWKHASNFSHTGLLTLQWECPNLVQMPYLDSNGKKQDGMWLLAISVNPGAPLGGSITQYYPGHFNGTHFAAVDNAARILDFGKDNYAGQFFYGTAEDEPPVFFGWASNWQYTQVVPTGEEGWRSAMTVPRRSYLTKAKRIGWKLVTEPYDLEPVMGSLLASNTSMVNGSLTVDFARVDSNALYWEANITGLPATGISESATLNFTFIAPQTSEFVRGGYYLGGDTPFFIDRGGAKGFDNVFFTDKFSTNSLTDGSSWRMSGILDRSILEVFLDGGIESATVNYFTTQPLTLMVVGTSSMPDGANVSVSVYALESAWAKMANERDGLVYGNQTGNGTASETKSRLFGIAL
ncbi:beta-fructofuranosidase [Cordyceps militaris]|uniref:Beta-fructofuranosidase n=1 Tax=Cordyceps militaris TaxID=73501 RepID=A0A2H4SSW6_CORMI|nr:beta-fructofuranosidase [Cordyceps militaris]